MDGHGQVVDEKDFSKTDNKSTSGTSGQVELWNQIVKRFGPCRPAVQEDKEEDFLSKEEIHQNARPTRPLVPPIAGDPKNGKSTRPLPVHTSPLPVQGEDHDHHGDEDEKGEGEVAAGDSEPEPYQPIVEVQEDAARREADYLEHVKTPEEDRLPTAEEAVVLGAEARRISDNWPGGVVPVMELQQKAREKLGSPLPVPVVENWLSESGYTETATKHHSAGTLWEPPSEEVVG
jgi:hypothetical protein